MEALSPSTTNVRLSAVRKLVAEARRNGMIGVDDAASLSEVPNIRQKGTRLGNWLTREQAKELLAVPDRSTLKGKRDYVILALLVGCALRRQELATLDVETIQLREGRWVLVDLEGKGRRVRTVAIPVWVKQGINAWMTAAGIEDGRLLRSISKGGKIGETLSDWAVWSVVEQSAKEIGIERFGAHDLRRTCAKLCRKAGGDLEQIKFLLGHSSIQTTERYLGSEQEIAVAVNDNLGAIRSLSAASRLVSPNPAPGTGITRLIDFLTDSVCVSTSPRIQERKRIVAVGECYMHEMRKLAVFLLLGASASFCLAARGVTAEELEQLLAGARSKPDAKLAQQLSELGTHGAVKRG